MSFLSYNLQYYDTAIREFEDSSRTTERVYLAKQLLKFAEDIADEGYTALSDALESTFGGITRLKKYIHSSGEKPFPIFASPNSAPSYAKEKMPLSDAVQIIQEPAQKHSACGNHYPLITELKNLPNGSDAMRRQPTSFFCVTRFL